MKKVYRKLLPSTLITVKIKRTVNYRAPRAWLQENVESHTFVDMLQYSREVTFQNADDATAFALIFDVDTINTVDFGLDNETSSDGR